MRPKIQFYLIYNRFSRSPLFFREIVEDAAIIILLKCPSFNIPNKFHKTRLNPKPDHLICVFDAQPNYALLSWNVRSSTVDSSYCEFFFQHVHISNKSSYHLSQHE